MEKELFEKEFSESLNRNFGKYSAYFKYQIKVFFPLGTSIFQVTKCLILELHFGTITLANNILERLLKLALHYKEVGLQPIPFENWNLVHEVVADKKYGSLPLGNSIEQCRKENLITDAEKDILFKTIRDLMRNGFSHADASKFLINVPDTMPFLQTTFSNPNDSQLVDFNATKVIPSMQSVLIEDFARINAAKVWSPDYHLLLFLLLTRLPIPFAPIP